MLFIAHDFVNMVEVLLFWPAHLACAEGSALQCCSLSQCFSSTAPNDIPAIHPLSRCGVKHARDATKQHARTGVRLKRLQRSKLTLKAQQTDPLLDTMDVSNQRGRPRKKKEQRKKPPLPIVSVLTQEPNS